MQRRDFLQTAAGAAVGAAVTAGAAASTKSGADRFKLKYAPHFGMFKHHAGDDVVAQLEFMADEGFTALEDNGMTRKSVDDQKRIAATMQRLNMEMGVFVANFGTAFGKQSFVNGDQAMVDNFLADLRVAVDVAKRVNAKWMTIVLGDFNPRLEWDYQTANAVEMLKRGAEIFEPHGLVMVMEPLNPWRDHAGMFLSKIPHAYQICKAVNSPAVKILNDIYHQQITEGNLIPNIDMSWDEIAYFQIGDNPGRKEPGTGEINYRNVFKHIHEKGFAGIMGMEHGNSRRGKAGERAVIDAYVAADSF
jgi:hydroxypyruvate isomerase